MSMIDWIFLFRNNSSQFITLVLKTVGLKTYLAYNIIFEFLKMCMYRCSLYIWNLLNNFRDGFYEILRLWERQHMTPGWSVSEALGDRIRALVSAKTELSNHLHFARLFQSQLIAVRIGPPLEKNIICLPSSKITKKILLFLVKISLVRYFFNSQSGIGNQIIS